MAWYEFDTFQFGAYTRILSKSGRPVALTPKAADLLLLFLENPGKLLSKEELKHQGWSDSAFAGDSTFLFQVHAVRAALGQRANGEVYIETLTKRGYRFVPPVQEHCPDPMEIAPSQALAQQSPTAESSLGAVDMLRADQAKPLRPAVHRWACPAQSEPFRSFK